MLREDGMLRTVSISGASEAINVAMEFPDKDYSTVIAKETPVGKTLRSGKYEVNNDMQNDPALESIRLELMTVGVCSGIALPIMRTGKMIAIFTLSSSFENFFDQRK